MTVQLTKECGYQTAYGLPGMRFCTERKVPGLWWCAEHEFDWAVNYAQHDYLAHQVAVDLIEGLPDGTEPGTDTFEEFTSELLAARAGADW